MLALQHVRKYEMLAGGGEVLESHLPLALPEYLNAEVALKTVPDVSEAVRWLKSTFMYLRVRQRRGDDGCRVSHTSLVRFAATRHFTAFAKRGRPWSPSCSSALCNPLWRA